MCICTHENMLCPCFTTVHYDKTAQGLSRILALAKNIGSTGHISLMWNSMIQHYLTKTTTKKNYGNSGSSHMLLSYFMWQFCLLFFFLFFHLSCIFIVNLMNQKMFWSCTMYCGVTESASLWKSLFTFSSPVAKPAH